MLEKLLAADRWLFEQINAGQSHSLLDAVLPVYRDGLLWIPLYLFLVVLAVHNFGWRVWPWLVALLASVALCDQVGSELLKPLVGRLRPCADPAMEGMVQLRLVACSPGYSFPSAHAASFTGVASFMFFTMRHHQGSWALGWWLWAMSIGYAQVYVGVHYPLDVVVGSLLGAAVGGTVAWMFNRYIQLPALKIYAPEETKEPANQEQPTRNPHEQRAWGDLFP